VATGKPQRGKPGRPPKDGAPRLEFLQVRFHGAELDLLNEIARGEYLELATWARRTLLKIADAWKAARTAGELDPSPLGLFRQIDLSDEERGRILRAATARHLDDKAFAKQAIMQAVETWEQAHPTKGL
jgi:hypothetical protein